MTHEEELMKKCLDCLIDNVGDIETMEFISLVWHERDKYNAWKEEYDNMSSEEWLARLNEYIKNHPDEKSYVKIDGVKHYVDNDYFTKGRELK